VSDAALRAIRDLIQEDPGGRGLARDPEANLINACPGDFAAACRSVAETPDAGLGAVTGFYIAHADPPCGETDGPLGALFLARALAPLGVRVALITDNFCRPALQAGLEACGLAEAVRLAAPPAAPDAFPLTHLLALERVGPSHTPESVLAQPGGGPEAAERFRQEAPAEAWGRMHNMRGKDITEFMSPAHLLFEGATRPPGVTTIGVGDGGNEIGMGKIPWDVVRRNIPNGGRIACRTATDHLIVCGVSNWGAYALAAGVRLLRGARHDPALFDVEAERRLLALMVERGPLVDGPTGRREVRVDGLPFERYAEVLRRLDRLLAEHSPA
jgi:hypothetical protein